MKRTNLKSTTFTLLAAVVAVIFTAYESRVQAQTNEKAQIADALWQHNEPLARRLFEEAFKSLAESNARRAGGASGNARHFLVSLLAGEMAARRDPDFARHLLGSLRPADNATGAGEGRDSRGQNGSEAGQR